MDLSGGSAAFRSNRLEQIFRDVRMGRFHPGNTLLAHELVGKLCLGVDPDDRPVGADDRRADRPTNGGSAGQRVSTGSSSGTGSTSTVTSSSLRSPWVKITPLSGGTSS